MQLTLTSLRSGEVHHAFATLFLFVVFILTESCEGVYKERNLCSRGFQPTV